MTASALIEHYYRGFNERRLTDAAALVAADAEIELMPGHPGRGPEGYLRSAEAWIAAFPDAAFTVQRVVPRAGSMCEVELIVTGTHRGALDFGSGRFRPKGARASLHARELLDVRDGKILTSVVTVDFNDLVNQLSSIDYDELAARVERICVLREALARAAGDGLRRREVAIQLGVELDAARRALRPHFNK